VTGTPSGPLAAILSYLLRLWRIEGVGQAATWHASLEHPHSGQTYHFASLEEAVDFLRAQMGGELTRHPKMRPLET